MTAPPTAPDFRSIDAEIIRCSVNPLYFAWNFLSVKDEESGRYINFHLWPAQAEILQKLRSERLIIALKARQLGITTVLLAYVVWLATFKPGSTILLFSKTLVESRDLIKRIRGMVQRLPVWLQPRELVVDSSQELTFSNGSSFKAFPSKTSGGDSFTSSFVLIDECDLLPDLDTLLGGCKPTIDTVGGQLALISRVDKSEPNSSFKRIYRAAVAAANGYWHVFLPWYARPGRSQQWYEQQKREIESRTGSLDELYEQYPATPEQALSARMLDQRLPLKWLEQCFEPEYPQEFPDAPCPGLAGLRIYRRPEPGREYVGGVDVAEGNPNSDESVTVIIDKNSAEQVATLAGKFEPAVLADYSAKLALWYQAPLLVERNNHGHACLLALGSSPEVVVLKGRDDKPGWLSDLTGKTAMYDAVADVARQSACTIHDQTLFDQLASIDVSTLRAPEGQHDDQATAFAIAVKAASAPVRTAGVWVISRGQGEAPEDTQPGDYQGVAYHKSTSEWCATITYAGPLENRRGELIRMAFPNHNGDGKDQAAYAINVAQDYQGLPPINRVHLAPDLAASIRQQVESQFRSLRLLPD